MQTAGINEQLLDDLYSWIDEIPLTRTKKDMKRDFSDGVLVAEVVKHYQPHLVELHNYSAALAVAKKTVNWHILNRKVFKKLGFEVSDEVISNLANCKPWAIEQFLMMLRQKLLSFPSTNISHAANYSSVNSATNDADSPLQHSSSRSKLPSDSKSTAPGNVPSDSRLDAGSSRLENGSAIRALALEDAAGFGAGDMVPKILLDQKNQELLAKDEAIQILQAKIKRFEHLLSLKDIRIDDLQKQLQQLASNSPQSGAVKNGIGARKL